MQGRRRLPNRGSFRPVRVAGPDPRRHVFTLAEQQQGGRTTGARCLDTFLRHLEWFIYSAEQMKGAR
jgi:hypothetical protein